MKINFFFPWNAFKFVFDKFARFSSFPFLPFHRRFGEKVCINILPDSQSEMKHGRREMKLNYLWNTCKQQRRRRHTRNRRHFWNIKMMRDCWSKKNRKGNFLQHAPLHYDYRSSFPTLPPVRDILHPPRKKTWNSSFKKILEWDKKGSKIYLRKQKGRRSKFRGAKFPWQLEVRLVTVSINSNENMKKELRNNKELTNFSFFIHYENETWGWQKENKKNLVHVVIKCHTVGLIKRLRVTRKLRALHV